MSESEALECVALGARDDAVLGGQAAKPTDRRSLVANLAWNLAGESLPVLAAVAAIPILLHRLGADRFGVLTLSWIIAGYFALFDFGLGRALTKAMAQELSRGRDSQAATLFWTSMAVMLVMGAIAGIVLATLAPWLARGALKIPLALQAETRMGFYFIALGLPLLVSTSALRAALAAADRFDLLNLIRTPSGIISFAAPLLMLPFTHSLAWLIAALILNRAASSAIYAVAVLRALPVLKFHLRFDWSAMRPLLGFGAWISVSNVITPMMVYLDRFLIGAMLSMAALTAYSVPMEIVSKSFMLPAAVSGVMFPAFSRSFAVAPAAVTALFARSLKLVALMLWPLSAAVVAFAPQIMALWIGNKLPAQSAIVLQILAVGAFATGLAWIPLALLHGAHRPDLAAKIHLVDFPIYALLMWIFVRKFGLAGAAFVWSGRLLAENLVIFAMASRFLAVSRREVIGACALLLLAIAMIATGAFLPDLRTKTIFICTITAATAITGWRFLLDRGERSQVLDRLPTMFGFAAGKTSD
jgi:O-antigen/teichoic acid export membrane protein